MSPYLTDYDLVDLIVKYTLLHDCAHKDNYAPILRALCELYQLRNAPKKETAPTQKAAPAYQVYEGPVTLGSPTQDGPYFGER